MGEETTKPQDLTRTTLAVLSIGILISSSFWILRPFITAIVWAAVIVIATWPAMLAIQARLWGRRGLAVIVMTLILLLVIVIPLFVAASTVIGNARNVAARVKELSTEGLPAPPAWLDKVPVAGHRLAARWQEYSSLPPEQLLEKFAPYAKGVAAWFLSKAGSVGATFMQFLLTVIIAAIMYAQGEKARGGVLAFARRLAGQRGEEATLLAAKAIRGVALGVVVTALIQTAVAGAGLVVCGVPAAPLLAAITFMLCIAQVGPIFVMVPAVAWLYWKVGPLWGTILLVFTVVACTIDNFIRPVLIKKGADLPLLLIFAGVIGGLIAFGIIGLFIGPVVLAVTHTLLKAWVKSGEPESHGGLERSGSTGQGS